MKLASKSKKRLDLLEAIQDGITTRDVFETIGYKNQSEDKIIQFIYPHLLTQLTEYVMEKKGFSRSLAKEKARTMTKWEGNVNTTVKQIQFMGTQNRPDMTIQSEGVTIAIEFKKGDRGSSLREGFGQSIVYSTAYDFVIYMFIDVSEDGRIVKGSSAVNEQKFLENLWDNFNVKFAIV